jgi:hypothetical protein
VVPLRRRKRKMAVEEEMLNVVPNQVEVCDPREGVYVLNSKNRCLMRYWILRKKTY